MHSPYIPKDIIKKKKVKKQTVIPKDYFYLDKEEIPEKIIVYFSKDIDVYQIDKTIKYRYLKLKENLRKNREYLKKLKNEYSQSVIESKKKELMDKINKESKFIDNIENDTIINRYYDQTVEILKICKNDIALIEKYLEIAKKCTVKYAVGK